MSFFFFFFCAWVLLNLNDIPLFWQACRYTRANFWITFTLFYLFIFAPTLLLRGPGYHRVFPSRLSDGWLTATTVNTWRESITECESRGPFDSEQSL